MKYPYRFTDKYMVDIEQIVSAEVLNSTGRSIILRLKTGDIDNVNFESSEECCQTFIDFCRVSTEIAVGKQLKG